EPTDFHDLRVAADPRNARARLAADEIRVERAVERQRRGLSFRPGVSGFEGDCELSLAGAAGRLCGLLARVAVERGDRGSIVRRAGVYSPHEGALEARSATQVPVRTSLGFQPGDRSVAPPVRDLIGDVAGCG